MSKNYHITVLISCANKVMLIILQARLQQYVNWECPDVQAGFRKGRGTRDETANICWIIHTPMYYFLSNLSFLDICYTSTTIPVMLMNFFREKKTISYDSCLSQIFFLVTCAGAECVLLAAMAYDRYVAICHLYMLDLISYILFRSFHAYIHELFGLWFSFFLMSLPDFSN